MNFPWSKTRFKLAAAICFYFPNPCLLNEQWCNYFRFSTRSYNRDWESRCQFFYFHIRISGCPLAQCYISKRLKLRGSLWNSRVESTFDLSEIPCIISRLVKFEQLCFEHKYTSSKKLYKFKLHCESCRISLTVAAVTTLFVCYHIYWSYHVWRLTRQ